MSDIIRDVARTNLAMKYPERQPYPREQQFFDESGVPAYAASDGRPVVSKNHAGSQSLLDNERYRLLMQGHGTDQSPYLGHIPMTQEQRDQFAPYGYRPDGSPKGDGFLGKVPMGEGEFGTEVSFDFHANGKNILAPLLVPGYGVAKDPYRWAEDHALRRIGSGLSPFNDTPEYAKPFSPHGQQSMVARVLAGDPSAKTPTDAQRLAAARMEAQAALMP